MICMWSCAVGRHSSSMTSVSWLVKFPRPRSSFFAFLLLLDGPSFDEWFWLYFRPSFDFWDHWFALSDFGQFWLGLLVAYIYQRFEEEEFYYCAHFTLLHVFDWIYRSCFAWRCFTSRNLMKMSLQHWNVCRSTGPHLGTIDRNSLTNVDLIEWKPSFGTDPIWPTW